MQSYINLYSIVEMRNIVYLVHQIPKLDNSYKKK